MTKFRKLNRLTGHRMPMLRTMVSLLSPQDAVTPFQILGGEAQIVQIMLKPQEKVIAKPGMWSSCFHDAGRRISLSILVIIHLCLMKVGLQFIGFLTSKSLAVRFSRFGNYVESDLGPASSQLPKGEYTLRLYLRHDNVQYLEKMKQLVLFLERNLEEKDVIPLNFFSEPDGPVMGNGTFKYSILVPGIKESFYLSPPNKDKLPKCSSQGSVLLGAISHGKLSYAGEGKNPQKNPVSYQISYVVPPSKAFCSCKTHGGSQY